MMISFVGLVISCGGARLDASGVGNRCWIHDDRSTARSSVLFRCTVLKHTAITVYDEGWENWRNCFLRLRAQVKRNAYDYVKGTYIARIYCTWSLLWYKTANGNGFYFIPVDAITVNELRGKLSSFHCCDDHCEIGTLSVDFNNNHRCLMAWKNGNVARMNVFHTIYFIPLEA